MRNRDPSYQAALSFMPLNQPTSPPASKHRRAFLSCERCRKRKSRCEPLDGQIQPCKRCAIEKCPCEFRQSRQAKRNSLRVLHSPQQARQVLSPESGRDDGSVITSPAYYSRRLNSTQPIESTGDNIRSVRGEELSPARNRELESSPTSSAARIDARTRVVSAQLHNAADALDLLTFAATSTQDVGDLNASSATTPRPTGMATSTPTQQPKQRIDATSAAEQATWSSFILIKKALLSKTEAVKYFDFFFEKLWPLKPIIPIYYKNSCHYHRLIQEEPLLSICLITIASRYAVFSAPHAQIRSERLHWQSWKILQRYLQSVMWGSPITRSMGAIASMLLLIDWHTKAINFPADFTDAEDELVDGDGDSDERYVPSTDMEGANGRQRYGMTSALEKLDILSPAYRSNNMSWSLLSNAIALAHERGCFDVSGTNTSNLRSESDNRRQDWRILVCVFIYLTDESLATRLGLEPLLPEKSRQLVRDRLFASFASAMPHSLLWESYFELSIEAKKGRDLLHSLRKSGANIHGQNMVPDMEYLSRALDRWHRQNQHQQDDTNALLKGCLDIEYHYAVMYSFGPASQALLSAKLRNRHEATANADVEILTHLAVKANKASRDLLNVVVNTLKPLNLLTYVPVRFWLFIVASSLHLLKETLTANENVADAHPNISLLRDVISAVHNSSPDDIHMSVRYAKFLGTVLRSSLQASSNPVTAVPLAGTITTGTVTTTTTAGTRPSDSEAATRPIFDLEDFDFGYDFTDVGSWDFPPNFEPISDPVAWWDASLGRHGALRFS